VKIMVLLAVIMGTAAAILLAYTAGVAAGAFPPPWFSLPAPGPGRGVSAQALLLLGAEAVAFLVILAVRRL
jgi:hypothetical protein